jgi:hypothetical protein
MDSMPSHCASWKIRPVAFGIGIMVVIDCTGRVRLIHTGYNSSETGFRRDLTQLLQSL